MRALSIPIARSRCVWESLGIAHGTLNHIFLVFRYQRVSDFVLHNQMNTWLQNYAVHVQT
jgi:hypothetical protein